MAKIYINDTEKVTYSASCLEADEESPTLSPDVSDVETLPKCRFTPRFADPYCQKQFVKFQRRRVEESNYFAPVVLLNILCVLNLGKFAFLAFTGEGPPKQYQWIFFTALALTFVGIFLSCIFTFMHYPVCDLKILHRFQNLHPYRLAILFSALMVLFTGNCLNLLGRTIVGACSEHAKSEQFCTYHPGSPPLFQFTTLIVAMLYGFIICKNLLSYEANLCLWAVNAITMVLDTYLEEANWARVVGIGAASYMILFVLQVLIYKEMNVFEYHVALQKSLRKQIEHSQERAEREKTQLKMVLANVAHDLKTPLQAFSVGLHSLREYADFYFRTNVTSPTSFSKAPGKKSAIHGILNDMEASYAFMMMQINRALDVSKNDSDIELHPKPESFYLSDIISWAMKIMRSIQSRVSLLLEAVPSDILDTAIITDKVWLQDNLLCLLSNAVKYSAESSTVTVRVRVTSRVESGALNNEFPISCEHLLFEVEDEGVGIPMDVRGKLFQPFSQAQRRAGGTGLGLYSLALRLRALSGRYGLRSAEGHDGSIFYFSIPLSEDTTMDKREPSQNQMEDAPSFSGTSTPQTKVTHSTDSANTMSRYNSVSSLRTVESLRKNQRPVVLVVDDSATTLKVFVRAITQSGATVDKAVDGFSALKLMKMQLYSAVVMDIQMPIMDGLESTRQLRQWEKEAQGVKQYIIGTSACMRDETREAAYDVGMDDFMLKPIDLPVLLEKIRKLHETLPLEDVCDIV